VAANCRPRCLVCFCGPRHISNVSTLHASTGRYRGCRRCGEVSRLEIGADSADHNLVLTSITRLQLLHKKKKKQRKKKMVDAGSYLAARDNSFAAYLATELPSAPEPARVAAEKVSPRRSAHLPASSRPPLAGDHGLPSLWARPGAVAARARLPHGPPRRRRFGRSFRCPGGCPSTPPGAAARGHLRALRTASSRSNPRTVKAAPPASTYRDRSSGR